MTASDIDRLYTELRDLRRRVDRLALALVILAVSTGLPRVIDLVTP